MIRGAGGGGGESQRTPVESPDSLVSIEYARIMLAISEGEIFGLVNGAGSVYFNNTPLETDGVRNFNGVTYDFREGTQDQSYMKGFPQIESNISVGTELVAGVPYVRTVSSTDISALRINFSVPRLAKQNQENGDIGGYSINYEIDVGMGISGPFELVMTGSFTGKTTGGYTRSVRIDLPGNPAGGWRVRVRRITAQATTSNIADTTNIDSVTEIIDTKFRYPNTALLGVSFDAQTFGGQVPTISADLKGRIIRVPTNYDPDTRVYSGVWDGTFKLAYTDNPAWVYYDLILHPRYGLGRRINATQVDKWGLYQIAQYCDQLVDDGKGGQEPRFTCNLYLQSANDALQVMQDISSIFRGITYWGAGQAFVSADMPRDPDFTYTNANVINGLFSYKGAKKSTRYTVALVAWNDPNNNYKREVEYVENRDAIQRYGIKKIQLTAFGCTSQGQAIRAGNWALLTNSLETDTVNFSVGIDSLRARPGHVIRVADNDRAGRRIGGRITASTMSSVTVDKVDLVAIGDEIIVTNQDGLPEVRLIESIAGKVISVAEDFTSQPLPMTPFAVESEDLKTQLYRIISISESAPLIFSMSAVKHEPQKFGNIDYGTIITDRPTSSIPVSIQSPPTNITAVTDWTIEQYMATSTMTVRWDAVAGASAYDMDWRRDDGDWVYGGRTSGTELDVRGIFTGSYSIRVKAINPMNIMSVWAYGGPFELVGKDENTAQVVNLRTQSEIFAIRVRWDIPEGAQDTAFTELMSNSTNSDDGAVAQGQIAYPTLEYLHSGMGAAITRWFKARLIDKSGNIGPWSDWVDGQSSADATAILGYLTDQITETQLSESLLTEIEKISGDTPGSVNERLDQLEAEFDTDISTIQDQLNDIVGTPDWDPLKTYTVAGELVVYDDKLYRVDNPPIPAGTLPTNTAYWELVGDYASLGESVAALTVRMTDAEADIDEVTGLAQSTASQIIGVASMFREDDGTGAMADAVANWNSVASYSQEVRTRATENEAMVQVTTILNAEVDENTSRIVTVEQTVATNELAAATRFATIESNVAGNSAAISSEASTRATADSALASDITLVSAQTSSNTAAIASETTARANADSALASDISTISASTASNTAAIATEQTARTNADSALASSISTVQTTVNGHTVSIQTNATSINNINGSLAAMYNIKVAIDVNGRYYSAGMGIGVENTPSGMQSQVLFIADRFAVMHAINGTPKAVFAIQGGQTFLDTAIIQNASITFAKISDSLQSDNYVAGVSGWRLSKAGGFELNANVAGQGRTQITNQLIQIWDSSNVLRVRMGIW